jgi:prepilin-type N-terminal cleavage/methylation domain-containing protein
MMKGRGQYGGTMVTRRSAEQGFTLVEMAIVLVIIGLIIGGILKGQEIVDNARVKSQVSQIDSVKAAIATFVDEYNYYPGDDPNAVAQLGASTGLAGNGDGLISSAANTPDTDGSAVSTESDYVWYHLQIAQLVSGVPVGTAPTSATDFTFQGKIASSYLWVADYEWTGPSTVTNKMIRITGNSLLTGSQSPVVRVADALQIDNKYDDGAPSTGNILAATYSSSSCCKGSSCQSSSAVYGLPVGGSTSNSFCALLWQIE